MNDIVCGPFLDFRVCSKGERPVYVLFLFMIFDGENFTEVSKI
jgi:hypothetical protein